MPTDRHCGVDIELFNTLWTSSDRESLNVDPTKRKHRGKSNRASRLRLPDVRLPDTVVYMNGHAVGWYFSAQREGHEGEIQMRLAQNVTKNEIFRRMTSRGKVNKLRTPWMSKRRVDIVAQFMFSKSPSVVFLDREQLWQFLDGEKEFSYLSDGMLQKFVTPKSEQNEIIRIEWTPLLSVLERRFNPHMLHDQRYPKFERAVTYEVANPTTYTDVIEPDGAVASRFLPTCYAIARHVAAVRMLKKRAKTATARVKRMVLYFKHGADNQLWFLWGDEVEFSVVSGTHHRMAQRRRSVASSSPALHTSRGVPHSSRAVPHSSRQALHSSRPVGSKSSLALPSIRGSARSQHDTTRGRRSSLKKFPNYKKLHKTEPNPRLELLRLKEDARRKQRSARDLHHASDGPLSGDTTLYVGRRPACAQCRKLVRSARLNLFYVRYKTLALSFDHRMGHGRRDDDLERGPQEGDERDEDRELYIPAAILHLNPHLTVYEYNVQLQTELDALRSHNAKLKAVRDARHAKIAERQRLAIARSTGDAKAAQEAASHLAHDDADVELPPDDISTDLLDRVAGICEECLVTIDTELGHDPVPDELADPHDHDEVDDLDAIFREAYARNDPVALRTAEREFIEGKRFTSRIVQRTPAAAPSTTKPGSDLPSQEWYERVSRPVAGRPQRSRFVREPSKHDTHPSPYRRPKKANAKAKAKAKRSRSRRSAKRPSSRVRAERDEVVESNQALAEYLKACVAANKTMANQLEG